MAVTGKLYGNCLKQALNKELDLIDEGVLCTLTTSTYTPDQDSHDYLNDVTNEVIGTGFTAGGQSLGNKTLTYTGATNVIAFDADDVAWTTSTLTARNAVVYGQAAVGTATTARPLICYQASDADISTTAGTFTVSWNASGIVNITVS